MSAVTSLIQKNNDTQTGRSNCQKHTDSLLSALKGEKKCHYPPWKCFDSDRECLKQEPQNFVGQADGFLCQRRLPALRGNEHQLCH